MPTAPTQTLQFGQSINVDVADFQIDGVTLDTTEILTAMTANPACATASIDPINNRRVKITGVAPGNTSVTVFANGVPAANQLTIPVTVTAPPPNLSRIDFVAASAPF